MPTFLETLARRVMIYDGAMGTSLQKLDLKAEDFGGKEGFNDYLVLTRPELIEAVHAAYYEAGADVVETNTFGGNRLKMAEYAAADETRRLNVEAARLARRAADRFSTPEKPRFVAGSLGPTGMLPSSDDPALSKITYEELAAIYSEQASALIEGGVDVLLLETAQDLLELKAGVAGCAQAIAAAGGQVALQVQVTLDPAGRMLLGTDVGAALATLLALPVDVIGLNCSTGPEHMREPVRYLAANCPKPLSVLPNAGLPLNVDGRAVYPQLPEPFAEALESFVSELGVEVVGGCCGTTPEHIAELARRLEGRKPALREVRSTPRVASSMRATDLHQFPKPLLVGERVNAQGSKRMKEALLAMDLDGIVEIAREQVEGGAHALDVCVALTERGDEEGTMRQVVKKLAMSVEAPLVIDSTEPSVIAAALETYAGRAIVNSINLENGRKRCDDVLPLVVRHGAAVVALTIDPVGMAKTAARKLEVARAIHAIAVGEYGLAPEDLIFDDLTFTLSTGEDEFRRSAVETLDGLRLIKRELPGVLTILGVSNVSFGLAPAARHVLNSVFLSHCVEAGLDLAIVNPAHIKPLAEIPEEERRLAEDLIFDRHPEALAAFISRFEGRKASAAAEEEDPTAGMAPAEAIHWKILHRKKAGIEALIDAELANRPAVGVLNEVLLPAMKDVGDKFGSGELILPFVLQSAEVMKKAVAHLEQYLDKAEGATKGTVVLATVYGDVHDIGKNLVRTILENNGYTVHDLGKQVPINTILDAAVAHRADAVGLSALLVSTSKQMPLCLEEIAKRGLDLPVIIGGAAINRSFGHRIFFQPDGSPFPPGVYYANDAFEGLALVDRLISPDSRRTLFEETATAATAARDRARAPVPTIAPGTRSAIVPVAEPPLPPRFGYEVLEGIDLDEVFACLDLKSLYRLSWGAKSKSGEAYDRLVKEEFEPRLEALKARCKAERLLQPKVIRGFFPAAADGTAIVLYDPAEPARELGRFQCPRQPEGEHLCLADYLNPVGGPKDVVGLQVVTMGTAAAEHTERQQAAGDYTDAYFLHGLSVQAAEALAEWAHQEMRRAWGLAPGAGKRYSWGYPAIPSLEGHQLVFSALPVEAEIGVSLTEAGQLVPEQSTAAIVLHHPEARYFGVRGAEGAVAVF